MRDRLKPLPLLALLFCPASLAVAAAEEPGTIELKAPGTTGEAHETFGWMPSWLKVGGEFRGRLESGTAFDSASPDSYYLNRLRVNATIQPSHWMRFFVEGQDARAKSLRGSGDHSAFKDAFDVRQAFAEVGTSEAGWTLRAGRQEIAVGDERLVGADNYWDPLGQVFDAVRVGYSKGRISASAFAGFPVEPSSGRMNRWDRSNRVAGLSVRVNTWGEGVVEPYAIWTRGGDSHDLMDNPGSRNLVTPGVRAMGELPLRLEYNVEMALQRGRVVADRASAWAGHWEMGWKPLKSHSTRLGLEYNFASGDKDPCDGKHRVFDDLYPAGFNRYGMADPIVWRNTKYPAMSLEVPVAKRWTVNAGGRLYWLATRQDGLYSGGEEYLVRNPDATSSYVGSQAIVSVDYKRSERWRLGAGYGYLFPGEYLRQSGYNAPLKTAYLQTSFSF